MRLLFVLVGVVRGRRGGRLGAAVGGWWAVVGALMLTMALAVDDLSDDDSTLDAAATREGLVVFGLVLVAGGLGTLWVARRANDGVPDVRQRLTWTFVAWCALTVVVTLANPAALPVPSLGTGIGTEPEPHPDAKP